MGSDNDFVDDKDDFEKDDDDGDDDDKSSAPGHGGGTGREAGSPRMRFGPNSWASVALHPPHKHHQGGAICKNLESAF